MNTRSTGFRLRFALGLKYIQKKSRIIAVTGNIASGKSTTCDLIKRQAYAPYKVKYFSSDKEVAKIYSENPNLRGKILKTIGHNKKESLENFKSILLQNIDSWDKIEKIVHPIIAKKMIAFIVKYNNYGILLLEMPLLFEVGAANTIKEIIICQAPKKVRMQRKESNKMINQINDRQRKSFPITKMQKKLHGDSGGDSDRGLFDIATFQSFNFADKTSCDFPYPTKKISFIPTNLGIFHSKRLLTTLTQNRRGQYQP